MQPVTIQHSDGAVYYFYRAEKCRRPKGQRVIFPRSNESKAAKFLGLFKPTKLTRMITLLEKREMSRSTPRKSLARAITDGKVLVYEERAANDASEAELALLRLDIKLLLKQLVSIEKDEAAKIEKSLEDKNVIEKVLIYRREFKEGLADAAIELLTWVKDVGDVIMPAAHLKRAVEAGWETYQSGSKNWQEEFHARIKASNYKEVVEALGFDPGKINKEQLIQIFEYAKLIAEDEKTQDIVVEFIKDYAAAQHSLEWTKMAGGAAFEIILTALLAFFTAGVGAAAALGSKGARLMKPLAKLGEKFAELAKKLGKRFKPKKRKKSKVGGSGKDTSSNPDGGKNKNKSDDDKRDEDKPDKNRDDGKTPSPTKEEIALAKSDGDTPEHRAARDKVARNYMENNGYTNDQVSEALGSTDGSRIGGVDLGKPVEVVNYPPPDQMTQYVRPHGYPGNWFDPKGGQMPDQLGISGEGRTLASFDMPKGSGLKSTSAPILDNWTNPANPVQTQGGGTQIFVNNEVKKSVVNMNNVGK